jgi:hypothetical protein
VRALERQRASPGSGSWRMAAWRTNRPRTGPAKRLPLRLFYSKPCPNPLHPRAAICARKRKLSSKMRRCSRPRALHLVCARRPRQKPVVLQDKTARSQCTSH